MVVLGIDPGYAIVGYGAINYENNSFTPISFGSIITKADTDFNRRLEIIYDDFEGCGFGLAYCEGPGCGSGAGSPGDGS